ncbi:hypothetical protein Bca52824_088873 [Brassica carinata]|uniref:Uncharacterized protein n=1 Tax=Brassica carinata TaxID=52824 RepID=A0A8X7PDK0_BRACI|nr:hypothetical protein Bca52824_088873 [Brassica carinata]
MIPWYRSWFTCSYCVYRPLLKDVNPEVDVLATPTVTEEVVADGEKWGQELQNRENILPWIRPLLKDVNPEVDVLATPTVTEEVVADGEKWGQELQNRENILPWIRIIFDPEILCSM